MLRRHSATALWRYLVPAEAVDQHHAGEQQQHAQALEGQHSQAQGAVVPGQAGGVVPAVRAPLRAGHTGTGGGRGSGLVSPGAAVSLLG